MNWKVYRIKKGKHTSYGLDFMALRIKVLLYHWLMRRYLRVWVKFPAESLYKDGGDADLYGDWNKMIGINFSAFSASNKNSANLGWKADTQNGWFYVTHYFNIDGKNIKGDGWGDEKVYNIVPYEEFYYDIRPEGKDVEMIIWKKINDKFRPRTTFRSFKNKPLVSRVIAPWFGGEDNDGNGLGGVAPSDVYVFLKFEWIRYDV